MGFFRKTFFLILLGFINQIHSNAQTVSRLDSTFGQGTFNSSVEVMAMQADGKVIVGGSFTYYRSTPVPRLARLNADGTLDKTFQAPNDTYDMFAAITALAVQPDGKIIVARKTSINDAFLIRLNQDGSIDPTFNKGMGFSITIEFIKLQADEKIIISGNIYNVYPGKQNTLVRLNKDGTIDNTFSFDAAPISGFLSCVIDANGKIIVAGSKAYRLNTDGSLDATFDVSGTGPGDGTYAPLIHTISLQSDGKLILGGDFHTYNGKTQHTLVRLNTDGTVDDSFSGNTKNTSGFITTSNIQPDGKIMIGGNFYNYNDTPIQQIARLNTDGSLDAAFNPGGAGTDQYVSSILIQPDGKIIFAGIFLSYSGVFVNSIARVSSEGVLERTFNPGKGFDTEPVVKVQQPDGKVLLSGGYAGYSNSLHPFLRGVNRMNLDGSNDDTFNAPICNTVRVNQFQLLPDGKIIITGAVLGTSYDTKYAVYRLNSDGSVDESFIPIVTITNDNAFSPAIACIEVQSDGKIILAGFFNRINGAAFNNIARLNADGTIDDTFNAGAGTNSSIKNVIIQPDQKILLAGYFTSYNGTAVKYITRLNPNGTIDNSFATPGTGLSMVPATMTLQPDGKIILAGDKYFKSFNGINKKLILRLNANGTLDNGFDCSIPVDPESSVIVCLLQQDGKIIIAGAIAFSYGNLDYRVFRLNADGSLDDVFPGVGFDAVIFSGLIQNDGDILLGGSFRNYKKMSYNNIIRFTGDPNYSDIIRGTIYTDANGDCVKQTSETPLASLIVKAEPGPYYGSTDSNGKYEIKVSSGAIPYTVTQQFNAVHAVLLTNQCTSSYAVPVTKATEAPASFDFANDVKACIFPIIALQHTQLIRCFRSNAYIEYCNTGNIPISNASIKVEYPEYLIPVSSVPMWTSKNGSTLTYDLGVLQNAFCGKIALTDSVDCAARNLLGITQCIKATISPNSTCTAQNILWDLSSTEVSGSCKNNQAAFVVSNTGDGNMEDSLAYRVFVNDTLVFNGKYKLISGAVLEVTYPSEGQTIRLEADQQQHHPGKSMPRAVVEGCSVSATGLISTGLVTTGPQDDLDNEVAMVCYPVRGSYDPNDKQAVPAGIGPNNQVEPGTEIEYTIRFQNTGTAPAYTVKVVDTLDTDLDVQSLIQGVASHAYTLKVTGKGQAVLTFTFNNINLPDSTADKAGSNGLVSFRIKIPADAVLGTTIDNKAYIYFDYNDAILTNNTMHTVGVTVPENLNKGNNVHVNNITTGLLQSKYSSNIKIYPNPSDGMITIEMAEMTGPAEMRISSISGTLQQTILLNTSSRQQINIEGVHQGMYIYEIWQGSERKSVGTLHIW